MDYRILYQDGDSLRIIKPDPKFRQPSESEADCLGRLHANALPRIGVFIACVPEAIPTDLTFRDAWELGNVDEPVRINWDKAVSIHRARLAMACNRLIEALNGQLERALERDNLPEAVAARRTKAIVRTLHLANLSHCKTIEELKQAIPTELQDVWNFYPIS